MAPLSEYRKKRDFERTPEPAGGAPKPEGTSGLFVVHKHAARRLHYDLRLESDGVLLSWAVPKGPSREPGERRLAIHVEDHPLEYADFEGVIPEGSYGAGTVMLWDRGRWRPTRREPGRIDFVLEGRKLRGAWTLVRMRHRGDGSKENWLLIKRRDDQKNETTPAPEDVSVATGRTLDQIAADRARTWTSRGEETASAGAPAAASLPGARRGKIPESLSPQLATLVREAPDAPGWLHEIKFDGYRILARVEGGTVRLISRNGKDWTPRFPEIAALLESLPTDAVLDGEVVAQKPDGTSSFRQLQEALSAGRSEALVYEVFDLPYHDGRDLTGVALAKRKAALAHLLESAGFVGSSKVQYVDHIEGRGREMFDHVCRLGLEGMISKRADASYEGTRSRTWLKTKCLQHEELLVGGYTDPSGSRTGFGALLLGTHDDGKLVYAGKVGTGFSEAQLSQLTGMLRELEVRDSPFDPPPRERGVHWVRPELVAEVEYTERTRDGRLRHPAFRGLREDKDPDEIRVAKGEERRRTSSKKKSTRPAGSDSVEVAGVRLSHPDRVLYPEQGVTKLALAQYYEEIARWILPQLKERPLTLLRCPRGRSKHCFIQKHPGEALPVSVPRVDIREKGGPAEYVYVRTIQDVIALVQAGTLELHVWGSRVSHLERPDLVVFDLDPAPDVEWTEVLGTARALRDRLVALGLEGFVRTTGGKGLHVVVPIEPRWEWDGVKAFAHGVARGLAHDEPKRLTLDMSKAKRKGRIFLDYLRNGRGATAIASYSTRAREGAPVAVPLRWDELSPGLTSDRYDLQGLRRRLSSLKRDPWDGFEHARRPLTRSMLEARTATGRKR